MTNVVFHHDPVAGHLEWPPCQYFGKSVGVVFLSIHMYRDHYVPVAECLHPFLATADVFEFRLLLWTVPRQKILAASLSISSVKGKGKIIPISSTT